MQISKLSELILARYGQEATAIGERDGREAATNFLAERFDEEIKGLQDTATELRAGLIQLMLMGDGMLLTRIKIPTSRQQ